MEKDRKLVRINVLEKNSAGVYANDATVPLSYSDGDESEQYLWQVIREATDLSCQSPELQEKIRDWSSKYHLCASRSNLLRGLALKPQASALELGAGCGAITRYLGEVGLQVDAIEGSSRRAEIARMRCRDLDNVTVIQGNFNHLRLPEAEYDYIFLIGVLEYAAMFLDAPTDEEALCSILDRVEKALRPDGLVFIALENRMGLKYWLGANEDHYNRPYIGLYDYPLSHGIRTYDRKRIAELVTAGTLQYCRFIYPFPDYKLPRLLLADGFVRQDRYASSLLYRLGSQDYQGSMGMECSEFLLWDSLQKNHALEEFANSFLIVLGRSQEKLRAIVPDDFSYFSGLDRAPSHRTITSKPAGKDEVVKRALANFTDRGNDNELNHVLAEDRYVSGPLLAVRWTQALAADPSGRKLRHLVAEYWRFLVEHLNGGKAEDSGNFDLLPFNIVIDQEENWQVIDREWHLSQSIPPEFILFRALLFFVLDNQALFEQLANEQHCICVHDCMAWFFSALALDLDENLDHFIRLQTDIVRDITSDPVPEQALLNSLYQPLSFQKKAIVPEMETVELYWAKSRDGFSEAHKVASRIGHVRRDNPCRFVLPSQDRLAMRYLRFDPGSRPGFFTIEQIRLVTLAEAGEKNTIWELQGMEQIVSAADFRGVHFLPGQLGRTFVAVDQDPQIIFEIDPLHDLAGLDAGMRLYCEVIFTLPCSSDMLLARQALEQTVLQYQGQVRDLCRRIDEKQRVIEKRENSIQLYSEELQQYEQRYRNLERSFSELVHSPVLRCKERLRVVWQLRRRLKRSFNTIRYLRNRDYRLVDGSGLFDRAWYQVRYPDIASAGVDPLVHFLETGWQELRDPHPLFSTSFYIGQNPDVREAKVNPLLHYIRTGAREQRNPSPVFHGRYYTQQLAVEIPDDQTPLAHYLRHGHKGQADPNPLFDNSYYHKHNPDVAAAGMNPLVHYQIAGGHELRDPGPFFSASYYAARHPELQQSDATPLAHYYLRHGEQEDWQDIAFETAPKISILTPVYNVDGRYLKNCVGSVRSQSYPNWELCLVDDGSPAEHIQPLLAEFAAADSRIKIKILEENQGIAGATNAAVAMATGEFITFLDNDDELAPHALMEMAKGIREHNGDIYYSDEEIIDADGNVTATHCKPDYSPDLLLSHNYITHLLMVRKALLNEAGGLDTSLDGAQDYDLILRLVELTDRIVHIPKVLYSWRSIATSTAADPEAKGYAGLAGRTALENALQRRRIEGEVLPGNKKFYYRVRRKITAAPLVSIIIPFKDQPEYLRRCVESILNTTGYQNFEVIGVDNNSEEQETAALLDELTQLDPRVSFIQYNKPFNYSAINNYAVEHANGEHLILMNNDIEVLNVDWLEALLEHSQRPEVGAVGAKLYYRNNTIQHAGVIIGIAGFAGHSHRHFPRRSPGYFNRLFCIQNLSAVTAALLMVKKTAFVEVGGLDEENLGTALNDVDFCLKLREKDYLNIFTPYCEAYHYESISRGYEDTPEKQKRFQKEVAYFQQRWARILAEGDPYYNPNLTLEREDFSLKIT